MMLALCLLLCYIKIITIKKKYYDPFNEVNVSYHFIFGLDQLLTEVKKAKKAMEKYR